MSDESAHLLDVRDLAVTFTQGTDEVRAVRGVSFSIARGETLALVGESGSGKSITALSILRLLPSAGVHHPSGSIRYRGRELIGAPEALMREVRGNRISMIFQEPMTSLNPLHTVERQIGEILSVHQGLNGEPARERIVALLDRVGIPDARTRLGSFPHQLSGGQRQRVMIAMALANEPDLLIADEPTTALDVTVQAQILQLLKDLQAELGMAILMITHDLGIVRHFADRVCVMQAGEIVEQGEVAPLFAVAAHPYTCRLLAAEPRPKRGAIDRDASVLLRTDALKVWFPVRKGLLRRVASHIKAVDGVDLVLRAGQTLGVVGESGSGKTTLGLALLRLIDSDGAIQFDGQRIDNCEARAMRPLRRRLQVVFQDPYGSLSPRMSVRQIVAEGLRLHWPAMTRTDCDERVAAALAEVGIDPGAMERYPHEFSGGQRQRIAIARAMVLEPEVVVLDEPTSALDVSVQAQIVDLLQDLQRRHGLAYLFISHDLKVVRALADEVLVMRHGRMVEQGPCEQIFEAPAQAYTQALLAAALDHKAADGGVVSE